MDFFASLIGLFNAKRVRPEPEKLILEAFKRGEKLTSYEANKLGHTVDSRKCICRIRRRGIKIKDYWEQAPDGRRYKVYYLEGA